MQSRAQSMIETLTSTAIGFAGSLLIATLYLRYNLPYAALGITTLCTVWSVVRGYLIRRYFNRMREYELQKR